MKNIIFRGKTTDNEKWVYGYAVGIGEKWYIIVEAETSNLYADDETDLYATEWYEVVPETVGQYIGISYDDVKVYEGDIIEHTWPMTVTRDRAEVAFSSKHGFVLKGTNYMPRLDEKPVIVGNAYDNPNMLIH